jgi:hypothetical protein
MKYKFNKEEILKHSQYYIDCGDYFVVPVGYKVYYDKIYEGKDYNTDGVYFKDIGPWSKKFLLDTKQIHEVEFKSKMDELLK